MSNAKWKDNAIQFPRLLCEINATQELDLVALAASMDITLDELSALFDRAHQEWEQIKDAEREPLDADDFEPPDDTPCLEDGRDNCDDAGTGEGRWHGRM